MISATEYKIGQEIFRPPDEKIKWLVVRLVERDTALVISETGEKFITTESYVMLKSEKGEIDFVVLLHDDIPVVKSEDPTIVPLPSFWRKHNAKTT